jgi:hypothetical protein
MSDEVRKYHEEESIGKTYDFRVARRLVRYIKPYWKLAAMALVLTLVTNVLISTQPYFTKSQSTISSRRSALMGYGRLPLCSLACSAAVYFLLCAGGDAE